MHIHTNTPSSYTHRTLFIGNILAIFCMLTTYSAEQKKTLKCTLSKQQLRALVWRTDTSFPRYMSSFSRGAATDFLIEQDNSAQLSPKITIFKESSQPMSVQNIPYQDRTFCMGTLRFTKETYIEDLKKKCTFIEFCRLKNYDFELSSFTRDSSNVCIYWNDKKESPTARIVAFIYSYCISNKSGDKRTTRYLAKINEISPCTAEASTITNFSKLLHATEKHLKTMKCHGILFDTLDHNSFINGNPLANNLSEMQFNDVVQHWHSRGYQQREITVSGDQYPTLLGYKKFD